MLVVENREPNGRANRSSAKAVARREEMTRPVLEARAKALGIYIPEPKRMPGETMEEFIARKNSRDSAMRSATPVLRREWAGCSVGQAIADEPEVETLWKAVMLIRQRRANYLRAIDAQGEQARVATLPVKPNPGETAPEVGSRHETRSEEEITEAQIVGWEDLRDVIFAVHPLAVQFAVDRICAEVRGANENAVPKAPLMRILRAVAEKFSLGQDVGEHIA